MPAIIKPEFSKIVFSEMCINFLYFKIKININRDIAAIQNGIAIFVRKSNGIPATVNPRIVSREIKAKQALWQT